MPVAKLIKRKAKSNFKSPEYQIDFCVKYIKLWTDLFRAIGEDIRERKIYDNEEEAFFQIQSLLALNHFKFKELFEDKFKNADDVLDILVDAVSLGAVKSMTEAQLSKLQVDWHLMFIEMNKCIGKLLATLPPEQAEQYKNLRISLT